MTDRKERNKKTALMLQKKKPQISGSNERGSRLGASLFSRIDKLNA